ncbi:MAG: GntR family transcriptional regulator [Chloroflexi bacterium]|nr:GntR family transcriptional regulator [Chloroflexota bacterium]
MHGASPDKTSRNRIYIELRRSIITGHRVPGERLSVEQLAENYGTSVTPIRDALQMLSEAGLVTIKPRSGYFVTRITLKKLRDLLELREILEIASVERAAMRITEAQLTALERVHQGYCGDDDEAYDRYTEENRLFHFLIAQASGNQELAEALAHLHDRLARFMVICRAGQKMEATHASIVQALRAHDVAAAREAIQVELLGTRSVILEFVIQQKGETWQLDS